jgi:uncharacterized protein YjbI with pentapeptide repeats
MAEEPPAPPPTPAFLDEKTAVERIQAIVGNARTVWFALIAFLAFIGLTLTSVRDLDFFSATATTQLPIVNIAIPTTTFFWSAAWLAAILHTYFHLYLLKLWDVLAEAPPEIDGAPLGDRVFPWLVVDWALRLRSDQPTTPRPMDWLASAVTWLVIWLATPLLLAAFWWRSMPAHIAWLSLLIAAALFASLYATLSSWLRAKGRLARPGLRPCQESAASRSSALPGKWRNRGAFLGLLLVLVSLTRTHLETQVAFGQWRWSSLAPIDLFHADIVRRPADWVGRDTAERRFRITWCRDRQIPADACESPAEAYHTAAREAWCGARPIENCTAEFRRLEAVFNQEWQEQWRVYLANLTRPNLAGRDLRGADALGVFLAGVNLAGARLEGANLTTARLEGANLSDARLEGATLSLARLDRASLFGARLERADLTWARLEEAFLPEARLEGANLTQARLDRANLRWAQLERAELSEVRMAEAWLEGANLRRARLEGVEWAGAEFLGSPAHSADFTGGRNLTQSQLAHVIGDGDTVLPLDAETGEQLYVWTCWTEPPPTLDRLLEMQWPWEREGLRAEWLCPPRGRSRAHRPPGRRRTARADCRLTRFSPKASIRLSPAPHAN